MPKERRAPYHVAGGDTDADILLIYIDNSD